MNIIFIDRTAFRPHPFVLYSYIKHKSPGKKIPGIFSSPVSRPINIYLRDRQLHRQSHPVRATHRLLECDGDISTLVGVARTAIGVVGFA